MILVNFSNRECNFFKMILQYHLEKITFSISCYFVYTSLKKLIHKAVQIFYSLQGLT